MFKRFGGKSRCGLTSVLFYLLFASSQVNSQQSEVQPSSATDATITEAALNDTEAKQVSKSDPYAMIREVGALTFDRMKNEKANIQDNPELLRDIMKQELMPYIDYVYAAFMVLGRPDKFEKREVAEFTRVFRDYLITSYAIAMGYYEDQTVEFEPEKDFSGRSVVTVRAVIKDEVRPDIKVAFKVRYNKRTNEWNAYDMVAEGISLVSSKRTEFQAIIRKDGIAKVIALMRETINKPITLQSQQAKLDQ